MVELKANALSAVPRVESLSLERNALRSIHPQAFTGARKLMLLNLFGNHITKLPPKGFQVQDWSPTLNVLVLNLKVHSLTPACSLMTCLCTI